jgi:smad nuclear-interacting protein 1
VSRWRRNRWGNKQENVTSISRPIKHEPNSEGEEEYEWGKKSDPPKVEKIKPGQKEKPKFSFSRILAEIKNSEPSWVCKSKIRWRLYPFEGDKCLPSLHIHRQSSYLIGRDRMLADIPLDHPSCSNYHASLQYRLVRSKREDISRDYRVKPYIIDLASSHGTFVNNKKIEPKTYVELLEKDVIKFGYSSWEYVLLREDSTG